MSLKSLKLTVDEYGHSHTKVQNPFRCFPYFIPFLSEIKITDSYVLHGIRFMKANKNYI